MAPRPPHPGTGRAHVFGFNSPDLFAQTQYFAHGLITAAMLQNAQVFENAHLQFLHARGARMRAHYPALGKTARDISDRRRSHCLWQLALCRAIGTRMQRPSLEGRSILIVEDEPLIVMDITQAFEATGAALTTTNTLKHALILVEHDGLSGAILDHALGDGNSSLLCRRLKERGIPFMIYSGYTTVEGPCKDALHISKPAADGALVAAMEGLIRGASIPTEMNPLLVEQRRVGDEYRVVEKVIGELRNLMATSDAEVIDRAAMEADVVARTTDLMLLRQRMLELERTVASLRPT
jgi:DNA-binding response OmpR family regulator